MSPRARRASDRVIATVSASSLGFLGAALVGTALARRRQRLAVAVATVLLGANATTEVLKSRFLPRPPLLAGGALPQPTYPSGHATVAMSIAVGLVLVVPSRWRVLAAVLGLGYACAIGTAVLTAGWHRPSDSMGAYLVVVGWAAAVSALLVEERADHEPAPDPEPTAGRVASPALGVLGLALLGAGFVGVVSVALAERAGDLDTVVLGHAYVAAVALINGVALLAMATLLVALRGVHLDLPPALTTGGADGVDPSGYGPTARPTGRATSPRPRGGSGRAPTPARPPRGRGRWRRRAARSRRARSWPACHGRCGARRRSARRA